MTHSNASVCVIVLSYFGSGRVQRCVESLIDQPFDTLYLVDNSADADEQSHLRRFGKALTARRLPFAVNVMISAVNLGFAGAINAAIQVDQRSGGHDYYLLLNDDAELPPGGIGRLLDRMEADDDVALVAARVITGAQDTQLIWYHRWSGHLSFREMPGSFAYLQGSCLLVDSHLVGKGGLLDEAFFMYGEDVQLSWRVLRAGLALEVVPEVIVRHEGTASSEHGRLFYEYQVARGHVLLASRLARSRWELPVMYLGRVAYLAARALVRSLRFRSFIPVVASVAAWLPLRVRPVRSP